MSDNKNAAKYAFFYLLSLFALIFTALSTGMVMFQLINKFIPDQLDIYQGRFAMEAVKFAISALVIAAPVYFLVMRQIIGSIRAGDLDKDSAVRRWLTYFILFVSSVVSIVWLIMTVNTFLNGDLTVKFLLKALTAVGISAAVFSYYLLDIRRDAIPAPDNLTRAYFAGALILVLSSFTAAILIVDSPAETRKKRFDERIINDFNQISYELDSYFARYGALPGSLEILSQDSRFLPKPLPIDGEQSRDYEYRVISEQAYELCAEFLSSSPDTDRSSRYYGDEWLHPVGQHCFSRQVRPQDIPAGRPLPEIEQE